MVNEKMKRLTALIIVFLAVVNTQGYSFYLLLNTFSSKDLLTENHEIADGVYYFNREFYIKDANKLSYAQLDSNHMNRIIKIAEQVSNLNVSNFSVSKNVHYRNSISLFARIHDSKFHIKINVDSMPYLLKDLLYELNNIRLSRMNECDPPIHRNVNNLFIGVENNNDSIRSQLQFAVWRFLYAYKGDIHRSRRSYIKSLMNCRKFDVIKLLDTKSNVKNIYICGSRLIITYPKYCYIFYNFINEFDSNVME